MSNRVYFTAMQFTQTACKNKTSYYGFIAADDYAREVYDGHEFPMPEDDKEFFFEILGTEFMTEALDGIIDEAMSRGAHLNDAFYDAEVLSSWKDGFDDLPENN